MNIDPTSWRILLAALLFTVAVFAAGGVVAQEESLEDSEGTSFDATTTTSSTISISVTDSSNGQDTETVDVQITTEDETTTQVPDWVSDDSISADQFRAFDTSEDGSLTPNEVKTGVNSFIKSLPNGEVNGQSFTPNEIKSVVQGFLNNL